MRLIDADKLKAHYAWWEQAGDADMKDAFDTIIDLQPTVEPKHGRWVEWDGYDGTYKCSVCRSDWDVLEGTPQDNGMYYCPNCGAKMDV